MTAPLTIINDPADGETLAIFDFGDAVGIAYPSRAQCKMEYWRDHAGSGSGCNNWILDAFGRELDLEFCSSRGLTRAEVNAINDYIGGCTGTGQN